MEWFWQMVEHLQKNAAVVALQSFSPIDWVFLFALLWGLVQGSRKGFSEMFGKLLGIVLVTMLTLTFYPGLASYMTANLSVIPSKIATPMAFFMVSIFLWLSVSWCVEAFGKLFKLEAQGLLKTLGGMLFGVLRVVLLISFVAQFLLFFPVEPIQQLFKPGRTYTGYTIARFVPDLHRLVMSPFSKSHRKGTPEPLQAGL